LKKTKAFRRRAVTAVIAASMITLGGLASTTSSAYAATSKAATPAVLACHTNAYEVKVNGNYVTAQYSVYQGSTWEGVITVELWYCPNYQSNFARAYLTTLGSGAGPESVDLSVYGLWGDGPNSATHTLAPDLFKTDGSQDSPTLYAPVEQVEACAFPNGPYTFGVGNECTAFA
jgi:hypothetical protein